MLFNLLSWIAPEAMSRHWCGTVSAVLAAILMTHIVNMLLAKL